MLSCIGKLSCIALVFSFVIKKFLYKTKDISSLSSKFEFITIDTA